MIEDLCDRIWSNNNFHVDRKNLVLTGLKKSIGNESKYDDVDALQKLLQCALHFSLSQNIQIRKAAYEIIISALKLYPKSLPEEISKQSIDDISVAVFKRLGNFPAVSFFERQLEMNKSALSTPSTLWMENEYHESANTVSISHDHSITLTDFQTQLWKSLKTQGTVTVNAPTSAGKSFVLQNYLASKFSTTGKTIAVYIVPTRALIAQVIMDLNAVLALIGLNVEITEVPYPPEGSSKIIYVLTQERLQILLDSYAGEINILIADEAQNISDGSRGIILQSVIERIVKRSRNTKVFFGCPFTKNPQVFFETFYIDERKTINTKESPVLQNLLFIKTDMYSPKEFTVQRMFDDNEFAEVSSVSLDTELVGEDQTICQLAYYLGCESINIIYGSEPAKCERIALILKNIVCEKNPEQEFDPELVDFSEFIKKHIHKDLILADTIKYGIAYHYGKMPAFLRKGLESLCAKGKISFIVCTSTLLQGVNLPAQNIFIMKPTKGHKSAGIPIPLTPTEFWNLSGRAGRLTKDFEGNIFLINIDDWLENPLKSDREQLVKPAFEFYLCDTTNELLEFMGKDSEPSGRKDTEGLESTFMKLYNDYHKKTLLENLERYQTNLGDTVNTIQERLELISTNITVPSDITQKNPNISVYRQQEMFDYLVKRIDKKGPRYVIPPHPLNEYRKINIPYLQFFKRLHNHFEKLPSSNESHKYYYPLAILWMKGLSYAELLKNRITYKNSKRKRGSANPNTEARGLFEDIENALRFRYVKYTKCYIDLLAHALELSNNAKYIESVPPIYLFLELGASSNTMMTLIGLGITRTTSSIIAKTAPRSDMGRADIRNWLSRTNIESFDLPSALKSEIKGFLM